MKNKSMLRKIVTLVLALALVLSISIPAFATSPAVQAVANGVFQVNFTVTDDDGVEYQYCSGTGFLINDEYVVTCNHCVTMTNSWAKSIADYFDMEVSDVKNNFGYSVTIDRDIKIPATLSKSLQSETMDFAILKLNQKVNGYTPLSLGDSDKAELTQDVYAVGFPAVSSSVQQKNTYTADDVTIAEGKVNKVSTGYNLSSGSITDFIQTSCKLSDGFSGAPLVDEDGVVLGVCQGSVRLSKDMDSASYYAVSINQIKSVCDKLGVAYNEGTTEPTTEAAEETTVAPTTEAATTATTAAPEVEEEGGFPMWLIIVIAAIVVAIAAAVVIILTSSKSKKKAAQPTQAGGFKPQGGGFTPTAPQAPAQGGFRPAAPQAPAGGGETTLLNSGNGETTLLNAGAGETTVLSQSVAGGSLSRVKTNETITISKNDMSVGRERSKVDYCVSGNTSIGRNHAKFVVKNGTTYIVDCNSTNGTFVNGVKAQPNVEVALKEGDKVSLADEDFVYHK